MQSFITTTNPDTEINLFIVSLEGLNTSLNLGLKACFMIFVFI